MVIPGMPPPQPAPMQGYAQPSYGMQQPGYNVQQQPAQQYMMQPQQGYSNQPAPARSYASSDRLPAYPGMLQRPAPQAPSQPVIRGAAPEMASNHVPPAAPPASPGWKPIHIPTPDELGIASNSTRPTIPATTVSQPTLTLPEQYDLGTVTSWLDTVGARSFQREKLAEGIQLNCQLDANQAPITVRGHTEKEALQKLVQEVVRQKQAVNLSQR